ncbi:MAG: DNA replication/repair protein RecF [Ruminococcus sp.]|nr:DNA replication/repair protein RecF [Ruminococcus sp.]
MKVNALHFENYRNLKDNTIAPSERVNVIYGENANGKTNLLEALWLFCGGHSFRGAKENELIRFDRDFFRLKMDFESGEREQSAEILFDKNKKSIKLNGVDKNSSSYLTEVFSAVVFSPEHLSLIKQGPNVRRRFLDAAICQQRIRYASLLSQYSRIIVQRNALLKDIYKNKDLKETLFIWDDSLSVVGAQIIKERFEYIRQMRESAKTFHKGISGDKEELDIICQCTAKAEENDSIEIIRDKLKNAFLASRHEDYHTGYTSVGPHRDDLDIKINGISARRFGSQGQQRSAVLSMKLSEAELLYRKNNERPVILLDDVLSELDNSRQDFLLNKVEDYQVFVTCCEESNKEQLRKGKVFYVNNGEVTE